MLNVVKPAQWNVFSSPDIQPIQYCSILKKKREFSRLIKEYDAEVFKPGYEHYCCIMPNNINSRICQKHEIFIMFFGEALDSSCIGIRIKVNQDTIFAETNFMSKFLKKSDNSICYEMKNALIHVKCKTNSIAWDLFYCLYDLYLRRYVLTAIGTHSFISFLYSDFIKKEKQLLELLYNGSKIVNISKRSIFYKIHKKRKLSVTDLINTAFIMPRFKKFAMGFFRFKKSYYKHGKSYVSNGGKFVSSIVQKKNSISNQKRLASSDLCKNIFCCAKSFNYMQTQSLVSTSKSNQQFNISQKRKFDEVDDDNHGILSAPSTSKAFDFNESNMKIDSWEIFRDFKPGVIKCYSSIPQVRKLVPSLLKNGSELYDHPSSFFESYVFQNENQAVKKKKETGISNKEYLNTNCGEAYDVVKNSDKEFGKFKDIGFTTAIGKSITVSKEAMLTAQRILKDVTTETKDVEFLDSACHNSEIPSAFTPSSKRIENDEFNAIAMDATLAKHFFEDTLFDDLDPAENTGSVSNLNANFKLSEEDNLSIHKPRKSLGGRRNIKYLDRL